MTELACYDYDAQRWITGEAARPLLLAALRDDREALAAPAYAKFCGLRPGEVSARLADIDAEILALDPPAVGQDLVAAFATRPARPVRTK